MLTTIERPNLIADSITGVALREEWNRVVVYLHEYTEEMIYLFKSTFFDSPHIVFVQCQGGFCTTVDDVDDSFEFFNLLYLFPGTAICVVIIIFAREKFRF